MWRHFPDGNEKGSGHAWTSSFHLSMEMLLPAMSEADFCNSPAGGWQMVFASFRDTYGTFVSWSPGLSSCLHTAAPTLSISHRMGAAMGMFKFTRAWAL